MRTCYECGRLFAPFHSVCPFCRIYTPTQEEKAMACEEIQKTWSPVVRHSRMSVRDRPVELEVWKVVLGNGVASD